MTALRVQARKVAIIGGGASGAITTVHIAQQIPSAEIIIIEPAENIGQGIAYSTKNSSHRLNVRAGGMSILPEIPDDFLAWVKSFHDSSATGNSFLPRMVFGQYLKYHLGKHQIEHCRDRAISIRLSSGEAEIQLMGGRSVCAQRVILATGHCAPLPVPSVEPGAVGSVYLPDAWAIPFSKYLNSDLPILLVGTGLTAIDTILQLRDAGFNGQIIAISRHGLMPYGHAPTVPCVSPVVSLETQATALAYFKAFRRALNTGVEWRAAIDSLRAVTNSLWQRLPLDEKCKFRRHFLHRWTVMRHRMAPEIEMRIRAECDRGQLVVRKGQVNCIVQRCDGATVTLHSKGQEEILDAACVINCTGPNLHYLTSTSSFLRSLLSEGIVVPGDLGMTVKTDQTGRVVSADGAISSVIYAVGPLRAGSLFETTAIPEIRHQASALAESLQESGKWR